MALGSSLTLPLSGGSKVLVRIRDDGYSSEYYLRETLKSYRAQVRHSKTKATATKPEYDRHNFEVVITTFAASGVDEFYQKFYFVLEQLPRDTSVELADGVADLAIASSNAFITELLGWQS